MKAEKVEQILKSKVGSVNKKRTKRVAEGYRPESYQPVTYHDALNLHWQSRNKQFKGCNDNCTFNPETMQAYSYRHWRFVDVIKGKVVFNSYRYSQTTSTHQRAVRSLLESLGIKIDLEVEVPDGLQHFNRDALPTLYRKLVENEIILNRKDVRELTKERAAETIREVNSSIVTLRKLGATIGAYPRASIKKRAQHNELERIQTLAEKRCGSYMIRKRLRCWKLTIKYLTSIN